MITSTIIGWIGFPTFPAIQLNNARLNRLAPVFPVLVSHLTTEYGAAFNGQSLISLTDSMPIITCSGKRKGKVAPELCDKGYNSTKKLYYFGMKLHGIGFYRPASLPVLEYLRLSAASEHDLTAQRQILGHISDRIVLGDKAFCDAALKTSFVQSNGELLTPIKYKKGQTQSDKQRRKAAGELFSRAVSSMRQPIESFFNWLIEHTDLQRASKVRSTKGLIIHVFGRIAATFIFKTHTIFSP